MRRLLTLATAGTLAALAMTAPAAAKGPSSASVTGPGLDHALSVTGGGELGSGTPLGSLVELGGVFPQVFAAAPDPTTRTRPTGDLGPRYRVAYRVPGPSGVSTIVQDVYPYAKPSPVTHMRAGQRVWAGQRTHGGWFTASPGLRTTLVAAGLPESPPAAASGRSFPWAWTGAGVLAMVVLLAVVLRRRGSARFGMVRSTA